MQERWDADPAGAVRLLLETEARQGEQYRACAARHAALAEWVRQ
jgi:monomeric isocitrate dehydrogenase